MRVHAVVFEACIFACENARESVGIFSGRNGSFPVSDPVCGKGKNAATPLIAYG